MKNIPENLSKDALTEIRNSYDDLTRRRLRGIIEQLSTLSRDVGRLGEECRRRVDRFTSDMKSFVSGELRHHEMWTEEITDNALNLLDSLKKGEKDD